MDVTEGVRTDVKTNNGMILPGTFRVIAGPCTVESYDQFVASAKAVKQAGFEFVRGGAFKPRTSPYSFQGLGEEGLKIMSEVSRNLGLRVVTEVMDPYDIDLDAARPDPADRRPQHGELHAAQARRRGHRGHGPRRRPQAGPLGDGRGAALVVAEYVTAAGGDNVVLCERHAGS